MSGKRFVRTLGCCLLAIILAGAGAAAAPKKGARRPEIDLAQFDFRDGDVVFQHWSGHPLTAVIRDVTGSQYSHCGMIVHRNGEPWVIEAVGPVRFTRLKAWMANGTDGQFAQMRPRNLTPEKIAAVLSAARKNLGLPYDIQYELDDEKIYCSELVYKAYVEGAGVEIGTREKLGDMNWKPHEAYIRALAGGELPLDREIVSPESVARSPRLKLMYSSFPPRDDEPRHKLKDLAGKWSGDYSIRGRNPVVAEIEFDREGKFVIGSLKLADGTEIPIRSTAVAPVAKSRNLQADVTDDRGINARLVGQFHDSGKRLVGTWNDDLGFRGVFALERLAE